MVEDFSKVPFSEQVINSETFAVESDLKALSGLPVVKEVIVFMSHIVAISFQCFTPLQ